MTQPADAPDCDALENVGSAASGPAFYDECFATDGTVRPNWRTLLTSLNRLGPEELQVRFENSQRLLREQGVGCFVPGKAGGTERVWQLDLLPLILGEDEWERIETALVQRARLLGMLLADLYGTQRLVRDGFVPAPLVYANPNYQRSCQAIQVKDGAYLQLYAADLARSPDGQWWVIADRTQAPQGLGFAMENRGILSRVLPETLREVHPRPVSEMLRVRLHGLRQLAPRPTNNTSIALLTPGQRNEAYFEHTYLARVLGLTLVEGDDLTVRDRRLFVKTLNGLRQVDVVLRSVRDSYCDPLELRPDSLLGTPGLVEAARAQNVSIANALGSGLLECPGFSPFLPALCRHLLGSDLLMPSLATWWCGQAQEQAYVRDHLDELVVRSAMNFSGKGAVLAQLSAEDRARWLEELELRPHEFVGQEEVRLSKAPVWNSSGEWVSHPFSLRVFVLHDGQDFKVMPGGLAWVRQTDQLSSGALSAIDLSKDVWVLSKRPKSGADPHLVRPSIAAAQPIGSDLPSRAADNFFWLGRYTERLEQSVRAARHILSSFEEEAVLPSQGRFHALDRLVTGLGLVSATDAANGRREKLEQDILRLLFDEDHPAGVREMLKRIHLAAFSVRDRLSADTWRVLNRLEPDAARRSGPLPLVQAASLLHSLVLDLAALSGMEMENMTRGYGWVFLDLGRRIERGIYMAKLMAVVLASGDDAALLVEPALRIADSVMTHRRRYFSEPRVASVFELLVNDATNPRSVAFQLAAIRAHAATLPAGGHEAGVTRIKESLSALEQGLPGAGSTDIATHAAGLNDLAKELADLSQLISEVFFSHVSSQLT